MNSDTLTLANRFTPAQRAALVNPKGDQLADLMLKRLMTTTAAQIAQIRDGAARKAACRGYITDDQLRSALVLLGLEYLGTIINTERTL